MYQVIRNEKSLEEWMKGLPIEAGVINKQKDVKNRLEQVVSCLDRAYGADRDLRCDLGGYTIILYGDKEEVLNEYQKILQYHHLRKEEYELEDEYKYREPEHSETTVMFRLYLCSSDYSVEIVTII